MDMAETNRWISISTLEGDDAPFLNEQQVCSLQSMKFKHDSELIRWFAPFFVQKLLEHNPSCSLLNSERHFWVNSPWKCQLSSPDWVGLHNSTVDYNRTLIDNKYDFEGALFGKPAHWDLRGSLSFIGVWKLSMRNLHRELGMRIIRNLNLAQLVCPFAHVVVFIIHRHRKTSITDALERIY